MSKIETMSNREFIARKVASFFKSGDVVNLGVGIPTMCSNYTRPGVWIQAENGLLGVGEVATEAYSVRKVESYCNAAGDEVIPVKGACSFDSALSFGMMRSGRVDASVLGCLQVAGNGDLANWAMPGRSPGMGGAMDIVSGVKEVIVATTHCSKDGSPKIVEKCTYPLTGVGVVDYIVTEYCVMQIIDQKLYLKEIRDNISVEELQDITAAKFIVADDLKPMELGRFGE